MRSRGTIEWISRKGDWEMVSGILIIVCAMITSGVVFLLDRSGEQRVMADTYCSPTIIGNSHKMSGLSGSRRVEQASSFLNLEERMVDGEEPCSRAYLFGTDAAGRDLFYEMTTSTFQYIVPVIVVVLISILLGTAFGVLSGYYHQSFLSRLASIVSGSASVFPPLILAWVVARILDPSLVVIGVTIGITESVRLGFSISSKIVTLAQEEFIEAAKEMGLSDWRIITRHILWANCRELLIIHSILAVSSFITIELYLGYLAAGRFDAWGDVIRMTAGRYSDFPSLLLLPSAFATLVLVGFAMIASGCLKRLDDRDRSSLG